VKKKKKKLELSQETLKQLDALKESEVVAGVVNCTCGGCYCTNAGTTCS
jgi:hypothetical protein